MKLSLKISHLYALLIIMFPICFLITNISDLPFMYFDEIVGVMGILYIAYLTINYRLSKQDFYILIMLCSITIIGLISNYRSQLTKVIFAVLVDAFWLWKPFACYFLFKYISREKNNKAFIIRNLVPFAKLAVIYITADAIISNLIDVGSYEIIGTISKRGIHTGCILFGSILILAASDIKKELFLKYVIIATIPMILMSSGLVYCWLFLEYALLFLLRKDKTLKITNFLFLGVGVIIAAYSDVQSYFLQSSIRTTFLKYAIVTAKKYFPFGSGFATYGSEMAARYYSKLYVMYGWKHIYGLNEDSQYLNDNFFASIIGQFGWFGFALYLGCLYMVFKSINNYKLKKYERITSVATLITLFIVMIGSAAVKNMMGCFVFAILGIVASNRTAYINNLDWQSDIKA